MHKKIFRVFYHLSKLPKFKRTVVALGVFDGVHYAHQRILKETVRIAQRIKGRSVVVTFWPDPHSQENIYSLNKRLSLISELGIQAVVVLSFNKRLAGLSAEKFLFMLIKRLGVRWILVGENFYFGRNAEGDIKFLQEKSREYNFHLKIFRVLTKEGLPVSSSLIRRLIKKGDIASVQGLLGRPISVEGRVIRGIALGRKLGFPTANIRPEQELLLPSGVYAVRILYRKKRLYGLAYIGSKPTLKTPRTATERHLEVYITNFNGCLYDEKLEIQFLKKIRSEKKFSSLYALAKQIKKDLVKARPLFSR